jgi:chromosome partitioning protein
VVLLDMDRQQSSLGWLERRADNLPLIHGLNARGKNADTQDAQWTIIDSPAGLHGERLSEAVKRADWVIVPMQASSFDIGATEDFLQVLREEKAIRKERTFIGMVGMRIDSRTRAAVSLQEYLEASDFPVIGHLRNAQIYVQAAELGASLFDLRPSLAARDIQQWSPLLQWLANAAKAKKSK